MRFGLNNILLRNVIYNIHIRIYTYFYGTGSDRKLKAYINHLLKSQDLSTSHFMRLLYALSKSKFLF